jgi:predicted dehydrogenase
MEGFMYRCHPQIKTLLKLIKEKKIGDIKLIKSSFGFDTGKTIPKSRLFDKELAGGAILDVGLYPISLSRLVAGVASGKKFLNPIKLTGSATIGETGVDEVAHAKFEFENGIIAEASTAIREEKTNNAMIRGSKGTIEMSEPWTPGKEGKGYHSTIKININDSTEIVDIKGPEHLFYFEAELASSSIKDNKLEVPHPGMTWEDTLGNLKTLDDWRKQVGYSIQRDSIS